MKKILLISTLLLTCISTAVLANTTVTANPKSPSAGITFSGSWWQTPFTITTPANSVIKANIFVYAGKYKNSGIWMICGTTKTHIDRLMSGTCVTTGNILIVSDNTTPNGSSGSYQYDLSTK